MQIEDDIRNLFNKLSLKNEKDGAIEVNETNVNQVIEHIPTLVKEFNSDNPELVLKSTVIFRKLLAVERSPPIQQVIDTGIVPRLIQLLNSQLPTIQFEAAWVLTNIASGKTKDTMVVIEAGAINGFVTLLNTSQDDDVKEQSIWALGNIAGNSAECRDMVLKAGALQPILNLFQNATSIKLSILRNTTWTLSNLCRGKPSVSIDVIKPALPILSRLLYCLDEEVLVDACWALSYLSDGENDRIQAVLESNVCHKLVELLLHDSIAVQMPALRAIGNIVSGDDIQTQVVLNCQVLPALLTLLHSTKKTVRKEAAWTISNLTAGGTSQIQQVIDANIIPSLLVTLKNSEVDIKREAAFAISNILGFGSPHHVRYCIDQGCIKIVCDLLDSEDQHTIEVALEGIEGILKLGNKEYEASGNPNPYSIAIEDVGGLDKIEHCQANPSDVIYLKAKALLETYYDLEDEIVVNK